MEPLRSSQPLAVVGRMAFALWLVPFAVVMAVLSLGVRVSLAYAFRRPDGQIILAAIALMWLFVGMVAVLVIFFKRALLPRLNDIGFRGPLRTFTAALWFVPPVNPLLVLALLLAPRRLIPEDPQLGNHRASANGTPLTPKNLQHEP